MLTNNSSAILNVRVKTHKLLAAPLRCMCVFTLTRHTHQLLTPTWPSSALWNKYGDVIILKTAQKSCSYRLQYTRYVDRDSSVGIVTSYKLDGPGIESRWPQGAGRRSVAARLLRLRVRIPQGARMIVLRVACRQNAAQSRQRTEYG